MAGANDSRARRALRARLERPWSYPQRDFDQARFLYLDSELYRARLPALSPDEVRREYLSVHQRLAAPDLTDLNRSMLDYRRLAVTEEISRVSGLPDLDAWHDVLNFSPPSRIAPERQSLGQAEGTTVSLDYYAVEISRMPTVDGRPMRAEELLDLVRSNLNSLVGDQTEWYDLTFDAGFASPVPPVGSPQALGTPIHIDMGLPDDGTVVITENTPTHFRATTVYASEDFYHPVSGHRVWGVVASPTGVTVFSRGADRPTGHIDDLLESTVFGVAHQWWSGWQRGTHDLIVAAGGAATIAPPVVHHVPWELVDTFMYHHELLADLDADLEDRGVVAGFSRLSPVVDLDVPEPGEAPITDADVPDVAAPPPIDPGSAYESSTVDGPMTLSLDPGADGGPTMLADPSRDGGAAESPIQWSLDPGQDDAMSVADRPDQSDGQQVGPYQSGGGYSEADYDQP